MKLGFWTTLLAALVIVTGAHAQNISETMPDGVPPRLEMERAFCR